MEFLIFLLAIGIPSVGVFLLFRFVIWKDGNQIWNDNRRRCWERNGRPGPLWSYDQRGMVRKSRKRQQRGNSRGRGSRRR